MMRKRDYDARYPSIKGAVYIVLKVLIEQAISLVVDLVYPLISRTWPTAHAVNGPPLPLYGRVCRASLPDHMHRGT